MTISGDGGTVFVNDPVDKRITVLARDKVRTVYTVHCTVYTFCHYGKITKSNKPYTAITDLLEITELRSDLPCSSCQAPSA